MHSEPMHKKNMDFEAAEKARTHQPCAACRLLRRRCDSNCQLAPYFPSDEIEKFAGVHRVFGASNVLKMIQMVEEAKRDDAVKAIVYEATARIRDPVYGSAGAIFQLQQMVQQLRAEVESIRARISEVQEQRDQLLNFHMNFHHLGPIFPINDPIFDGCSSTLPVEVDHNIMAYDPFEFPVEGDWVL